MASTNADVMNWCSQRERTKDQLLPVAEKLGIVGWKHLTKDELRLAIGKELGKLNPDDPAVYDPSRAPKPKKKTNGGKAGGSSIKPVKEPESPKPVIPEPPTLKVDDDTEVVELSWNRVSNADLYSLYCRTGNSDYQRIAQTRATTMVDRGVQIGTAYRYRVTSANEEGESSPSNAVVAVPKSAQLPEQHQPEQQRQPGQSGGPRGPQQQGGAQAVKTEFKLTHKVFKKSVEISWSGEPEGFDEFVVVRSDGEKPFQEISEVIRDAHEFLDVGVEPGTYLYRVFAYGPGSRRIASSTDEVTIEEPRQPAKPGNGGKTEVKKKTALDQFWDLFKAKDSK